MLTSLARYCQWAWVRVLITVGLKEPWMKYSGSVDSGDPQASRTIDKVAYGRGIRR